MKAQLTLIAEAIQYALKGAQAATSAAVAAYKLGKAASKVGSAAKITFKELATNGWARAEVLSWGAIYFDDEIAQGFETMLVATFPELKEEEQASVGMSMLKFLSDSEVSKATINLGAMLLAFHPKTLTNKYVFPAAGAFAMAGGTKVAEKFLSMTSMKKTMEAAAVAKREAVDWMSTVGRNIRIAPTVLATSAYALRVSMRARAFVTAKGHRVKIAMEILSDTGHTLATVVAIVLARNPLGNWVVTRTREINGVFSKLISDINGPQGAGVANRDLAAGLALAAVSLWAAQTATDVLVDPSEYETRQTSSRDERSRYGDVDDLAASIASPEKYTFFDGRVLRLDDFASMLLAMHQAEAATADLVGSLSGRSSALAEKAARTRMIEMALEEYERGNFENMRDIGDTLAMPRTTAYSTCDVYHRLVAERVPEVASIAGAVDVASAAASLLPTEGSANTSPRSGGGNGSAGGPATSARSVANVNGILGKR